MIGGFIGKPIGGVMGLSDMEGIWTTQTSDDETWTTQTSTTETWTHVHCAPDNEDD